MAFAGAPYLALKLPDYERDGWIVTVGLVGMTIVWLGWLPSLFSKEAAHASTPPPKPIKPVEKSSRKSQKQSKKADKRPKGSLVSKATPEQRRVKYVPLWASTIGVLGFLVSTVLLVLLGSPYNTYSTRRVFQAPLLTKADCDKILRMAHTAAQLNVELANATTNTSDPILQEPTGWQKKRHNAYPTNDLNLVTDPFTKQDRQWLGSLLDRRLAPFLNAVYGVPITSIRANDMFVVRYDMYMREHLRNHTDSADISFNVLLNTEFEGTV